MNNKEFLERALIATDKIATAGKLNPKQAQRFVDYVVDESILKDVVRIESFRNEEAYLEEIGVHSRVAMAKEEAVDPQRRRSVTHTRIPLKPSDMIVPWELTDEYRRWNVEGNDVEDTVIRMMATQFANDIDELALDGNLLGPARIENDIFEGSSTTKYIKDKYMALQDGFLKLAESGHVVDAANSAIGPTIFNKAILSMPTKFRKRKQFLKYMISPDHEQGYRKAIGDRLTQAGDKAIESMDNLHPFGIEMVPVPMLEKQPYYVENSTANTDGTTATALTYKPITELVLIPTALGSTPEDAYILGTDYSQDLTNGTWTRLGGGSIPSGGIIKATYRTAGKMLLTLPTNLVIGIGLNISIERDRNIFKAVNEFAIHAAIGVAIGKTDAVVLVTNIKDPLA